MQQRLKERLVGAAVLVVIAVIFIPMILTGPIDSGSITKTNIPDRPSEKFSSKLIPLTDTMEPVATLIKENAVNNDQGITDGIKKKTSAKPQDDTLAKIESGDSIPGNNKTVQETIVKDKQVGLTAWVVQLGSFSSKVNADKLNLKLRKSGFPAFVEPLKQENETVYRVRVGPELLRADADVLLKKIKTKMKLVGIVLSYP
ncbi:MAG: SPOR domain-containing protein [Proteobacteria bacterium]|nr:SPOR domain-containing protein [Pseudomonadota bacterium]